MLSQRLSPRPHQPGYVLTEVDAGANMVVAIRGTDSIRDIVSDVDCLAVPFLWGFAHRGFARAADDLVASLLPHIIRHAVEHPDAELVVTGHSMGAGVATLATLLLRHRCGVAARCVLFGPPSCVSPDLASACRGCVIGLVNNDDFIPSLSERSVLLLIHVSTRVFGLMCVCAYMYVCKCRWCALWWLQGSPVPSDLRVPLALTCSTS